MGPDGNVTDGEKIVLRMVVGIGINLACGNKDERGVDVYWEFYVSILISVDLKFRFLLGGLIECFVFFLLILHLLFDSLIDLAKPLSTR
jgi:hypothetical protein